jgi:protease I
VAAAICLGPLTLARAGVVEDKRVTTAAEPDELQDAGAIVTFAGVGRDRNIIAANSPGGARRFGETMAVALGE